MKAKEIRTIKQEIALLKKEDKRSHEILVEDFTKVVGLQKSTAEAIALSIVKGKRKQ